MDNYIQEPVETGGFILWKNSQRRGERENNSEEGLEKHADLCLLWSTIRHGRKAQNSPVLQKTWLKTETFIL